MGNAILAAIVGYLLGSIPFGLLLTRIAGHGDIRDIGSGSIGATNVLRTGSKGLAALTLAFDVAKGLAAVLIGSAWSEEAALAGGAAVIVGHMYPVWLGFRGGKGVATALGVLIVIAWPVAIGAALLWLATAVIFRYSSLAALVAAVASAALAGFVVDQPRAALIALIAILVVVRHRQNVQRLLAGTESRISFGKDRIALAERELAPQERLDWLRLSRTDSIGPITFYALLRRFGSAAAALDALPSLSRPVTAMSRRDAEAALTAVERIGARLICWGEPLYPAALAAVEDAPPVLTMLGRPEMILAPMVAVVGARNASANGRRLARELAAGLGESGIVVVSGLARGIDAAAHLGALATGSVAIVAGGVDIVYPEENRGLYDALARDGAILAELPLGTEPQARHFPRRNRIISGVALGVVVVEAAAKSGSLITARFALEQGREVFAVPGSPLDPRSRGANDLLRSGATLTETAADILAQLGPLLQDRPPVGQLAPAQPRLRLREAAGRMELPAPPLPIGEDAAIELIVEKLSPTPVAVDELVRQCQLSAAAVATLLLELELAGRIERHPGNLVSLR